MTQPATDAEILAHIEANSTPATMVRMACGDVDILTGEYDIADVAFCDDCGVETHIVGIVPTAIVSGL
jgi:hypothetical protein